MDAWLATWLVHIENALYELSWNTSSPYSALSEASLTCNALRCVTQLCNDFRTSVQHSRMRTALIPQVGHLCRANDANPSDSSTASGPSTTVIASPVAAAAAGKIPDHHHGARQSICCAGGGVLWRWWGGLSILWMETAGCLSVCWWRGAYQLETQRLLALFGYVPTLWSASI